MSKVTEKNRTVIARAIRRNLVEFGYSDLTEDKVSSEMDKLFEGIEPDNIIGMMIKGQLEENNLI